MNYVMYYDYDNYYYAYECQPKVRNGAVLEFFDCRIKINRQKEPLIIFWINGNGRSQEEAYEILVKAAKILSYIFAVPFISNYNYFDKVEWTIESNDLLPQKTIHKIKYIEFKINKLNKMKDCFYHSLDLIVSAYNNLFKDRQEDAFMLFFKSIEYISKTVFATTSNNLPSVKKKNKKEIKEFLEKFSLERLKVQVTDDMLNNKVDLAYKLILEEFYG